MVLVASAGLLGTSCTSCRHDCGLGKAPAICVDGFRAAPTINGEPWRPDGGMPRVFVELACDTGTPFLMGINGAAADAGWDVERGPCCQFNNEDARARAHPSFNFRAVDTGTREPILPRTTFRPTETELADGWLIVEGLGHVDDLRFSFTEASDTRFMYVALAVVTVAASRGGAPWDRDGSGPDVVALWGDGPPIVIGEDAGTSTAAPHRFLTLSRQQLLADGIQLALDDDDSTEWVARDVDGSFTQADVERGERVLLGEQLAEEIRLVARNVDRPALCD